MSQHQATLVVIDNAEVVAGELLEALINGLVSPEPSQVLLVIACAPGHEHHNRLNVAMRSEIGAPRIHRLDVAASMTHVDRLDLIETECPQWPAAAVNRLASRANDFAEVLAVTTAAGSADVQHTHDPIRRVDELIATVAQRQPIGFVEAAVHWFGGVIHSDLLPHLTIQADIDVDLVRAIDTTGPIVSLRDGSDPRYSAAVSVMLNDATLDELTQAAIGVAASVISAEPPPGALLAAAEPLWHLATHGDLEIDDQIETVLVASEPVKPFETFLV